MHSLQATTIGVTMAKRRENGIAPEIVAMHRAAVDIPIGQADLEVDRLVHHSGLVGRITEMSCGRIRLAIAARPRLCGMTMMVVRGVTWARPIHLQ
jgi:hypothetical protein